MERNDVHFCTYSPPKDVSVHGLSFREKKTDWTSYLGPNTMIRIIRGIPGLATDSPCSFGGHGWTIYLLYDGPLLDLGFYMAVCVKVWYGGKGFSYWFLAFIHVLYITLVLPIIFPLRLIYSQIAFYTKYIVLAFSIDIVSTLSKVYSLHNHISSIAVIWFETYVLIQLKANYVYFMDLSNFNTNISTIPAVWHQNTRLSPE